MGSLALGLRLQLGLGPAHASPGVQPFCPSYLTGLGHGEAPSQEKDDAPGDGFLRLLPCQQGFCLCVGSWAEREDTHSEERTQVPAGLSLWEGAGGPRGSPRSHNLASYLSLEFKGKTHSLMVRHLLYSE